MAKTKKPEQAIFYQNFKGAIYGGTPEQVKNLMTAFCQYAFDGVDNPTVAPDIAMTFGMMKASVDADRKHYQEVCEQNRINALKKTGLTITGFIQYALDTNEYITFTVDDEAFVSLGLSVSITKFLISLSAETFPALSFNFKLTA